MLIDSPRIRPYDYAHWEVCEREDTEHAARIDWEAKASRALDAIGRFAAAGPCYAGVSWGKDSVVVAHLIWRLRRDRGITVPIVFVRIDPRTNPDCALVRDKFLSSHPHPYSELVATWNPHDSRRRHQLWDGFRAAEVLCGSSRYVSGIRGRESVGRRKRMRVFGISTAGTCAPIGWWSGVYVFAYLHQFGLPVHPAYACTLGGAIARERIRVGTIGGSRGGGRGREGWEAFYYGDVVRMLHKYASRTESAA